MAARRRSPSSVPVSTARPPHSGSRSTTSSTRSSSPTSSRASRRGWRSTSTSRGRSRASRPRVVGVTTGARRLRLRADRRLRHRGHHRRPAAQARHEPDGPDRDQRQDRRAQVAEQVAKHSPEAVVIVVSNPLDEMTALTANVTGFPKARVIGQAGMLDTARFTNNVAEAAGVPVGSVTTLTLGSHGDTMVPVPSACTVDGKPLADVLDAGDDRRPRRPHPQRRRRGRRAAQDRVGLLRALGRRRADGQGGRRGQRRRDAGVHLGRRRVRHRAASSSASRPSSAPAVSRKVVERDLTDTRAGRAEGGGGGGACQASRRRQSL